MLHRAYTDVEGRLAGWPDGALTALLVLVALALLAVACWAGPVEKAVIAAWVLFP